MIDVLHERIVGDIPQTNLFLPNFVQDACIVPGLKADVDRAKQAALLGEDYNPAIPGVGAAWSHNFLNQVHFGVHGVMLSHAYL